MIAITLTPRATTLVDRGAIYCGAVPRLAASCRAAVKQSTAAVSRIVARGGPAYGINTGFYKPEAVRIDAADLNQLHKHNVQSRAAATGGTLAMRIVRLMMALKLSRFGQNHPGNAFVRFPARIRRSGDRAPLAHMRAAMIDNATTVIAIALLMAAQACDFRAPLKSSVPLPQLLREAA